MPGALDSGWYLQICAEGLNAHERAVLLAPAGSGHHHHEHHEAAYLDCELGGASAEFASAGILAALSSPAVPALGATPRVLSAHGRLITPRLSRAPPTPI